MSCRVTKVSGTTDGYAIVCSRNPRFQCCCVCYRPASQVMLKLCDFPIHGGPRGATCDEVICTTHAQHYEPDYDLCPTHARTAQEEE
jgi:hypothetical protein